MLPLAARRVARGLLAAGLLVMGTAHFRAGPARTMAAMIPPALRGPALPSPEALVAFTGACELAGAAGLLVPRTRRLAGACLLVFLAAVFPANAYAARHPDRFGAVAIPFRRRLAAQIALGALTLWVSRDETRLQNAE
jgi:uncharacterized membrane protein